MEVDTEKHRISFCLLLYMSWHEPQVLCRKEVKQTLPPLKFKRLLIVQLSLYMSIFFRHFGESLSAFSQISMCGLQIFASDPLLKLRYGKHLIQKFEINAQQICLTIPQADGVQKSR